MNSNTRKLHKGAAKKQHKKEKKQLEQTLISRFMETVKSLGHNAESIGEDVARASKRMAKKLARTFAKTKKTSKPLGLPADKNLSKTLKKGAKSVPAISSIGVAPIASEEKVKAAIGADKAGAKRKTAPGLIKVTAKAVASSKTAKVPAKTTATGLTKGTTKAASSKTAKAPAKATAPGLTKGTTKTAAGSKSPDKMPLNVDKKSSRQAKAASKPATSAASDTRPVSDTVKSNKGRKVAASSKALAEKKIAAAELNKKHNN